MEDSSKILRNSIKLLLRQNKDSLCLTQPWGATEVRGTLLWRRHELSKALWKKCWGIPSFGRAWAEIGISVRFGGWSPGADAERLILPASSERWVCPGKLREPGVALAQTFPELFAELGPGSSSPNSAGGSSSPALEPTCWFTLLNPFLAPDTPGSVWCGWSGQFTQRYTF